MILPDFILPSRINQRWLHSGIDSAEQCQDRDWFDQYPHAVDYCYNSRGFRDQEWPTITDQLKHATWCIGDSFTVGLGSPVQHTWPYLLQQHTDTRTINVSMDGASNKWIARKLFQIISEIKPKIAVVQWSYLFRDEDSNSQLDDEQRRLPYSKQSLAQSQAQLLQQFIELIKWIEQHKHQTTVIHSFIPGFCFSTNAQDEWSKIAGPDWPSLPMDSSAFANLPSFIHNELKAFAQHDIFRLYADLLSATEVYVEEFVKQDLARDGHHYDLVTARGFVNSVCKKLHDRTV